MERDIQTNGINDELEAPLVHSSYSAQKAANQSSWIVARINNRREIRIYWVV